MKIKAPLTSLQTASLEKQRKPRKASEYFLKVNNELVGDLFKLN
jgi:hypothetical protein